MALQASSNLETDLAKIIADNKQTAATVAVTVRDAGTGAVLFSQDADTAVIPASNNKIETSAAAFGILGPDFRFSTSVSSDGTNLYLKGTGDPTMQAADYDKLAADVAAKGITRLSGSLVADTSEFDDQRTPPDWERADLGNAFAAGISALTVSPDDVFDAGSVKVTVAPGADGGPPEVTLTPPSSVVTIDNEATTGAAGSKSTLAVARTDGESAIQIKGSVPAGGAATDHLVSVPDPTSYALDVFRSALNAHGVTVAGTDQRGTVPGNATAVTSRQSIPLSQLAVPYLKLSNNIIAETLVKAIGRKAGGQGSLAAGLPAIDGFIRTTLGVDTSKGKQTDGSGLSRTDQTTVTEISDILRAARAQPWFNDFQNALPLAGEPGQLVGGTLVSRMTNPPAAGNVRAKTGTLTGVSALSGYVTDPNGTPLIFSTMLNGIATGADGTSLEDAIATRLASGTSPAIPGGNALKFASGARPQKVECSWNGTC